MGPASGVPPHWWTTPMATKALMALLASWSGNPGTGSTFPAQCETEEVYSALCKQITRGALSHNEKMRNFQDAKICLQLKPRRFKSRLQIPQTPSRQPMLTDEGKSIQSLTALQEFAAVQAKSDTYLSITKQSSYSSSAHYPPNFAFSDN